MALSYQIGDRPERTDDVAEAIELLRGRSTGTLGHWKSLGYAPGLHPLVRPAHAVGEVVTAQISPFDASAVHYGVSLLDPGDVLVVSTAGELKRAPWGGGTSYAAYQSGAAGVIVDGPITDWDEVTRMGVATWCTGTTSITYRRNHNNETQGGVNVPVSIAGAIVRPGDIAFADSDGVFFLERYSALSEAQRLQDVALREVDTWRDLAMGKRMYELRGQKEDFESKADFQLP